MVYLELLSIPPSANHAYFNLPRGGRALSKDGKQYKRDTVDYLTRNYRQEMMFFKKDIGYLLWVRFYFEKLENKGWHQKPKKAKRRYKIIDLGNRLKLFEDSLKDATGIDDSEHMNIILQKKEGPPKTEVYIWRADEETPFDELL
jgi:hypothetical protein